MNDVHREHGDDELIIGAWVWKTHLADIADKATRGSMVRVRRKNIINGQCGHV